MCGHMYVCMSCTTHVYVLNDASHLRVPHLADCYLIHFYYFVQVMNSERGHHAVIALLHRQSGRHRHGPGYCNLAESGEVCEI